MKFFRVVAHDDDPPVEVVASGLQGRFDSFRSLLESNNRVLGAISDLEEKVHGEFRFDLSYIHASLGEICAGVAEIIEALVRLGGDKYEVLRDRFTRINTKLESILIGAQPLEEDEFTMPFDDVSLDLASSVGVKAAQLGEMRTRLKLPVPDGFVITAWAYTHFVDANNLQSRISQRIETVDARRLEDLVAVSDDIQQFVCSSPVPENLADAIRGSFFMLAQRTRATRFALRSSAIGEDSSFSFAGQYATFLNLRGNELVDKYREVLASKFTPKAIYYLMSHSLREADLAMSVACQCMVDARASGVAYSRDPVDPGSETVVVHAVYGLGQALVDGSVDPQVFKAARGDGRIIESYLPVQQHRLVMGSESGTACEPIPDEDQRLPAISDDVVRCLTEAAILLENNAGMPQDIEWAVDQAGDLVFLQSRSLTVLQPSKEENELDISGLSILAVGGTTVCPGAGAGPIHHVRRFSELAKVPEGCVLVAPRPVPGLVAVIDRVVALVTEVGGVASHMATLAREYRVPTVMGLEASADLPQGIEVTVDATKTTVYAGRHPELVDARRPRYEAFHDADIYGLLREVLTHVSPLNLLHPSDENFLASNCVTFHDITRFAHQMAMEEMFTRAAESKGGHGGGLQLKSRIPLQVSLVYLDRDRKEIRGRWVRDDNIGSDPMTSFWKGVASEGWPKPPPVNLRGFMSVISTHFGGGPPSGFSESSFAILSREYMNLSLRLGYHFTTIESMCTDDQSQNYIRIEYKHGGASIDRRVRRIRLITDILSAAGFDNLSRGDFLDSRIAYLDRTRVLDLLGILGRLSIMTKQLDMALSSDAITDWYTRDFMTKLGIEPLESGHRHD